MCSAWAVGGGGAEEIVIRFGTFYNIESGSLAVTVELYVSREIAFHTKWGCHAVGKDWGRGGGHGPYSVTLGHTLVYVA